MGRRGPATHGCGGWGTVPPRPLEPAQPGAARGARGGGRGHAPPTLPLAPHSFSERDASFQARPRSRGVWGPASVPRGRLPSPRAGPPGADAPRPAPGPGTSSARAGRGAARRRFTAAPGAQVLIRVKYARRLLCESEQLNGLNESDDKDLIAISLPAGLRRAMRRHLGERFTKRGRRQFAELCAQALRPPGHRAGVAGVPRPRGRALEGAPQP